MTKKLESKEEAEERKKRHYETLLGYAEGLTETERDLGKEYLKSLLTFSGGALGLSVTLVSGAFNVKLSYALSFLYISWILFALCILLTIFALKASQMAFQKEVGAIYNEIREKKEVAPEPFCAGWDRISDAVEIGAGIFFIAGIGFLLYFVYRNLILYGKCIP